MYIAQRYYLLVYHLNYAIHIQSMLHGLQTYVHISGSYVA